jgi:hypothetical protein
MYLQLGHAYSQVGDFERGPQTSKTLFVLPTSEFDHKPVLYMIMQKVLQQVSSEFKHIAGGTAEISNRTRPIWTGTYRIAQNSWQAGNLHKIRIDDWSSD